MKHVILSLFAAGTLLAQITPIPGGGGGGGGSGTVTSVTCGTGLTGGAITTSGTCAVDTAVVATKAVTNTFAELQTLQKGANISSSTALATAGDIRYNGGTIQFRDASGSQTLMNNPFTTRGDLVIQGASGPARLAAGSSGLFLMSNGAASDPSYQTPNAAQITNAFDKSTTNSLGAFYFDMSEQVAPSAPGADVARLYVKDNGSGTTKVCYKDSAAAETCIGSGGGSVSNYYTSTTGTGIGPTSFTPTSTQTLSVIDATATTGATAINFGYTGSGTYTGANTSATSTVATFVIGQAQGSNPVIAVRNNSGTLTSGVNEYGTVFSSGYSFSQSDTDNGIASPAAYEIGIRVRSNYGLVVSENASGSPVVAVRNTSQIVWTNTDITYDYDTGLKRAAAGVVAVTNASTGLGRIVLSQASPSASTDACTAGSLWADANYVYACTSSGVIKRATLNTF